MEHVDVVQRQELDAMQNNSTIAVLLPGASFFTDSVFANPQQFIERDIPIALATDFNPGSSPTFSMQMIISLACLHMKMSAAQAITAATINAAYAVNMGDRVGSLEPGKQADFVLFNIDNPEQLPYYFGGNLVDKVVKKGKIIYE